MATVKPFGSGQLAKATARCPKFRMRQRPRRGLNLSGGYMPRCESKPFRPSNLSGREAVPTARLWATLEYIACRRGIGWQLAAGHALIILYLTAHSALTNGCHASNAHDRNSKPPLVNAMTSTNFLRCLVSAVNCETG